MKKFLKYYLPLPIFSRRGGVAYSSGKADMYNVKLEANNSQINFQLPEYDYGKIKRNRRMEIIFKGE